MGQTQPRGDQQGNRDGVGQQGGRGPQQTLPRDDDRDNEILFREREKRGPFAIVFKVPEDNSLSYDRQHSKDLADVMYMMSYIGDDELANSVLDVTRHGGKTEGKVRPIRVQFRGQLYRDVAVRNGFQARYMNEEEYLKKAVICKDLCREDRERSKRKYEQKKQQRAREQDEAIRTEAERELATPPAQNEETQGAGLGNNVPPQVVGQDTNP